MTNKTSRTIHTLQTLFGLGLILFALQASAQLGSFVTPPSLDTTAPVFTANGAPTLITTGDTQVVIRWVTDKLADARVSYGINGQGMTQIIANLEQTTEHLVTLTRLTANTA